MDMLIKQTGLANPSSSISSGDTSDPKYWGRLNYDTFLHTLSTFALRPEGGSAVPGEEALLFGV